MWILKNFENSLKLRNWVGGGKIKILRQYYILLYQKQTNSTKILFKKKTPEIGILRALYLHQNHFLKIKF